MSTATADQTLSPHETAEPVAPPVPAHLAGDPSVLGLPVFVVGSLALAFTLVGLVSPAAGGAPLAIIMAATGLGLVIAAVWAAALGQSIVAAIFGIFAGFWLSYAALVLGLNHNWFVIPAGDVQDTVALFQITWAILIGALTVACLRLPLAFTLVNGLIVLALVLLAYSTLNTDETVAKLAGYVVFAFAAIGIYLFLNAAALATGGKGYPLGNPVQR